MKKAVKKSLTVVLAALLVSAAGAVLAGCGCETKIFFIIDVLKIDLQIVTNQYQNTT